MPTHRRQLTPLKRACGGVAWTLALLLSSGCMGDRLSTASDATADARFAATFEVPEQSPAAVSPPATDAVDTETARRSGDDIEDVEPAGTTISDSVSDSQIDQEDGHPADSAAPIGPEACEALTAVITADYDTSAVPMVVTFHAKGSCTPVEIVSTLWSFGVDDALASGEEVTFTYLHSGSFIATLTLTDAEGSAHAATMPLTVSPGTCPELLEPITTGALDLNQPAGPSGLAASRTHDDTFWFVSDSGSEATLYATNSAGEPLGSFPLDGAQNVDWEDIALGQTPGSEVGMIYIWDGGDNNGVRDSVRVLMVSEPTQETLALSPSPSLSWSALDLTYPDGDAFNSDTLMADPQTGDLLIVSTDQETLVSHVFRKAAPHTPDTETSLTWIAELVFGEPPLDGASIPSGGDFSPLGDRLMIRTDDDAFLWLRDGASSLEDTFGASPCLGPFPVESGGEAITFSADGQGYHTIADEIQGTMLFNAFAQPETCDTPEARISVSPLGVLRAPVTVTFEADPSCVLGGIDWVKWTLGEAPTTELSPTHTFIAAEEMEVTLTVADFEGTLATTTQTIEVLPPLCPTVGPMETWGTVGNSDINEASGIVMSAQHEDLLWVHNDSGDTARFFALGSDGAALGTWTLDTSTKDWEDLAYGYDATLDTDVLYIGDVGDNTKSRTHVTIFIVPEPNLEGASSEDTETLDNWSSMTLTYPEGEPQNCETLMRDPTNGDLFLVTKSGDGVSPVFRKPAPHIDGSETELEWVGELLFGTAPLSGSKSTTAGAFSPNGDRIVIRTYSDAWLWRRAAGESVAEALAGEACNVEAPTEAQGEAICFKVDGAGYITLSEGTNKALHYTPLN